MKPEVRYTLENTENANFALIHKGSLSILILKSDESNLHLNNGKWERIANYCIIDAIADGGSLIELSRTQADIDALFNDLTEGWVTGYGRVTKMGAIEYYWIGNHGYSMAVKGGEFNTYGYECNEFVSFDREDFTIIATRSPITETVIAQPLQGADYDEHVYNLNYTKAEFDNGDLPIIGQNCMVTPHNTTYGFPTVDRDTGKIIAVDGDTFWWSGCLTVCITRFDKVDFHPIDNRKDKEKAIDDLQGKDNCYMSKEDATEFFDDINSGKVHGIEYTGK